MLNANWDDRPEEYAATRDCWLTRRRTRYVREFLREASSGQRVLELGSGVGELLIALAAERPDLHFTGIEPQRSYVEFCREAASKQGVRNLCFRTASAEDAASLLNRDAPFDWILSNDMLHHVADQAKVVEAMAQVARPGARWLAIEPNWRNPYVLVGCALKRGERNFWPASFLAHGRNRGWSFQRRSFLFLIPPFVKNPPRPLIALERNLEKFSLLGGGLALTLLLQHGSDRSVRHSTG
jgi:2-polyprenyl-3-methyl-5-hydroxy-6-metoxy-1,4-benzoquinol methylase